MGFASCTSDAIEFQDSRILWSLLSLERIDWRHWLLSFFPFIFLYLLSNSVEVYLVLTCFYKWKICDNNCESFCYIHLPLLSCLTFNKSKCEVTNFWVIKGGVKTALCGMQRIDQNKEVIKILWIFFNSTTNDIL